MDESPATDSSVYTYIAKRAETLEDRQACMNVRYLVFVNEQQVPFEEESDTYDDTAVHFMACITTGVKDRDEVAATARLVDRGDGIGKVGRVAALREHRNRGVGSMIMRRVEDEAREIGMQVLILDSQVTAIPFYERLGYLAEGPVFLDAGIEHRRMSKRVE